MISICLLFHVLITKAESNPIKSTSFKELIYCSLSVEKEEVFSSFHTQVFPEGLLLSILTFSLHSAVKAVFKGACFSIGQRSGVCSCCWLAPSTKSLHHCSLLCHQESPGLVMVSAYNNKCLVFQSWAPLSSWLCKCVSVCVILHMQGYVPLLMSD